MAGGVFHVRERAAAGAGAAMRVGAAEGQLRVPEPRATRRTGVRDPGRHLDRRRRACERRKTRTAIMSPAAKSIDVNPLPSSPSHTNAAATGASRPRQITQSRLMSIHFARLCPCSIVSERVSCLLRLRAHRESVTRTGGAGRRRPPPGHAEDRSSRSQSGLTSIRFGDARYRRGGHDVREGPSFPRKHVAGQPGRNRLRSGLTSIHFGAPSTHDTHRSP